MKNFDVKQLHFPALIDQLLFSCLNFSFTIILIGNISIYQTAQVGVMLTTLYITISIARNYVSGSYFFSRTNPMKDERNVFLGLVFKTVKLSPISFCCMFFTANFLELELTASFRFGILTSTFIVVDNLRQIALIKRNPTESIKLFFLTSFFFLCIFYPLTTNLTLTTLDLWILFLLLYVLSYFISLRSKLRVTIDSISETFQDFSRPLILDSILNHCIFYFYNLLFFVIDFYVTGEIRLITIWIVNIASTVYTTLNSTFTLNLINGKSTKMEQRFLNVLALLSLVFSLLSIFLIRNFVNVTNFPSDLLLSFCACLSFLAFFIHSRITALIVRSFTLSIFLTLKVFSWLIILMIVLIPFWLFGKVGFEVGSAISLLVSITFFEIAMKYSTLFEDSNSRAA